MSVAQVAEWLGISECAVRTALNRKELRGKKVGRSWRVRRSWLVRSFEDAEDAPVDRLAIEFESAARNRLRRERARAKKRVDVKGAAGPACPSGEATPNDEGSA